MDRYIEKFMRYLEIEKNYSKYTILNYRLDLEDFNKFLGDSPLEKIDYLALRKYLAILKEKKLKNKFKLLLYNNQYHKQWQLFL